MHLDQSLPQVNAGLGAIPDQKGVHFRVWAPHAEKVSVTGSFCEWSPEGLPLKAEKNGHWAAHIPKAKPGDEYKFVLRRGQDRFLRNDPYARQLTHSSGNSLVVDWTHFDWDNDNFQLPPWNELVIYELHVGTFNVTVEGKPGNFADVLAKLPDLKNLGINCLEIMPTAEFPGGISWGYNPAHPFAIESEYGGVQGLQELVKAAHKAGIGVIMDVVYNHFGPGDLDLWQFDGWHENGLGGIYFYNDWKAKTPWGDSRPDYGRPEVRQYLRDNARMWLQDYHLDGLRWDATAYIRNVHGNNNPADDIPEGWSLLQMINQEITAEFPGKLLIAEDLQTNEWLTKPVAEGGAGFHAQWCPEFVHPVRAALVAAEDADRSMYAVAAALTKGYGHDSFRRVIYTESHDEVANGRARISHEIAPGDANSYYAKKRSTLGGALVLTAPGIPMLFQGQTMNESGWFDDHKPLDWSNPERYAGIVHLYKDLIRLRQNKEGHTRGLIGQHSHISHLNDEAKVLVFQRWEAGGAGDHTVIVCNFSQTTFSDYRIGVPTAGTWELRFNSDWEGYNEDFGAFASLPTQAVEGEYDQMPFTATLNIPPYAVLIFSQ